MSWWKDKKVQSKINLLLLNYGGIRITIISFMSIRPKDTSIIYGIKGSLMLNKSISILNKNIDSSWSILFLLEISLFFTHSTSITEQLNNHQYTTYPITIKFLKRRCKDVGYAITTSNSSFQASKKTYTSKTAMQTPMFPHSQWRYWE